MARADVGRLVLASSMVVYGEGRYECAVDGVVPAAPRRRADLDAGRFEPPVPGVRPAAVVGHGDRGDARPTRATPTPRPSSARSTSRRRGPSSTGGGAIALRYHNVYGPRMPRDTPYAGVAAIFRSALEAGRAPRVFEDGGQQRDFVHVTDVAEANLRALLADPPESALRAYNVASGHPHTVGDMARALADAFGGPEPVVTGEYRIGDVRHVVASPVRAEKELGFRARVEFEDGMRAFATDPAAARPLITRGCGRRPRRRSRAARTAASQNRCDRGGSVAVAGSSQTTNGSQIRSVSPSTRPERVADRHARRSPRAGSQSSRPRSPASPATTAGPAAIGRGGEVGREEVVRRRRRGPRTRRRRAPAARRRRCRRTTSSRRG